jgi:hypothetical protein
MNQPEATGRRLKTESPVYVAVLVAPATAREP